MQAYFTCSDATHTQYFLGLGEKVLLFHTQRARSANAICASRPRRCRAIKSNVNVDYLVGLNFLMQQVKNTLKLASADANDFLIRAEDRWKNNAPRTSA
jgi:hypothetical protein